MDNYTPPFEIIPKITDLLVQIGGELVHLEGTVGSVADTASASGQPDSNNSGIVGN